MDTVNDKPTTPLAIWSLILGIAALVFCCLPSAIPAIICGHLACSKVRQAPATLSGGGMALAGLIMGYLSVAGFIVICVIGVMAAVTVPSVIRVLCAGQQTTCCDNLHAIETAKQTYALEHGKPQGWVWDSDEDAFRDLVDPEGTSGLNEFPRCPSSEFEEADEEGAAKDYNVNAIGVKAACVVKPDMHRLQK